MKIPRLRLNSRVLIITGIVVLILLILGLGFYFFYEPIPPEEVVKNALEKTFNAESYKYTATSKRIIDNKEEILSQVTGEKSNGNVHFYGKLHIVNSEFEIYQVGNKFYRKDVFSKDWLVVEDANIEATEKLIQEINPLGAFKFNGPIDVEYAGKEKINNKKCKKYEVMAQTENKYLEVLWKDFLYTIWVDKEGTIMKAEITAVNKQHSNHKLVMSVEFLDYNNEIVINPPIE